MPTRPLPIDTDPRTAAWRWLVATLRAAPSLKTVDLWWVHDDTPLPDALPTGKRICMLTPTFETPTPYSINADMREQVWEGVVSVQIEVRHIGEAADNSGNWAGACEAEILAAYYKLKRTPKAQRSATISWIELGTPPQAAGDDVVATGQVRLYCHYTL